MFPFQAGFQDRLEALLQKHFRIPHFVLSESGVSLYVSVSTGLFPEQNECHKELQRLVSEASEVALEKDRPACAVPGGSQTLVVPDMDGNMPNGHWARLNPEKEYHHYRILAIGKS